MGATLQRLVKTTKTRLIMNITRRQFMAGVAGSLAGTALLSRVAFGQGDTAKYRLSACDWSVGITDEKVLETAKAIGLQGIEFSANTGEIKDTLRIADPAFRKTYKEMMTKTGMIASSTAMGFLNDYPLATDPRGPAWLDQTIDGAKDLGAKVILVAFFGKGDLREGKNLKAKEVDAAIERIKEAAPKAQAAGVILGIENTLSAKDNLMILDSIKSDAVRVYYDVGNSTGNDYDVPAEIRDLGNRICQFHFKDGGHYLGKGEVKFKPIVEAINAINYQGWFVLETSMPSKDRDADFKKNVEFVRKTFKMA
jgi:L-ribulose-5-phosphate 3-epimerase